MSLHGYHAPASPTQRITPTGQKHAPRLSFPHTLHSLAALLLALLVASSRSAVALALQRLGAAHLGHPAQLTGLPAAS